MKVPPRPLFWARIISSIVALTTQLAIQSWMFTHVRGMCTTEADNGLICPHTRVFGAASIIWGVISPHHIFGSEGMYHPLLWFLLIGAVAPVIPWALSKRFPEKKRWFNYINMPVIFGVVKDIPPARPINYISATIVGFIFNYVIRRRRFLWWSKYNYVLSAALDSGVAVSSVLIYFLLQYPKDGTIGKNSIQAWWGNTVYQNTYDGQFVPAKTPDPSRGVFGPTSW